MSKSGIIVYGLVTVVVVGAAYMIYRDMGKKKKAGGHRYRGDLTNPTAVLADIEQAQKAADEGQQIASYFA